MQGLVRGHHAQNLTRYNLYNSLILSNLKGYFRKEWRATTLPTIISQLLIKVMPLTRYTLKNNDSISVHHGYFALHVVLHAVRILLHTSHTTLMKSFGSG